MEAAEATRVSAVHFDMAGWANQDGTLVGRERAIEARAALEHRLGGLRESDPVALQFTGVSLMTVSFTEAFFVPLLGQWSSGYYEEHPLVVVDANDEIKETLDLVLRVRRVAVLSIAGGQGDSGTALLGGERGLRETVQAAFRHRGKFLASDIAAELGISVQNANNRLKDLVQRGALHRSAKIAPSGGRQFVYEVPLAEDDLAADKVG